MVARANQRERADDVSEHLPILLQEHQPRWAGRPSYFYADSGSSAGKFLNRIAGAGFSRWSVSYNQWTGVLDCLAAELPESQWSAPPPAVFERHRLKGAKEQRFSEVLSGLDLHHPPCSDLVANQAFYAIAMLAYNVLISLKLLELPDEAQSWRIATLIRQLISL
jgi:hypothetical protein